MAAATRSAPDPTVGAMVSELIAFALLPGTTTRQADDVAGPLLQLLCDRGEIPRSHGSFVEWAGLEHDLIAVCHFSDGSPASWINVNRDGSRDFFEGVGP